MESYKIENLTFTYPNTEENALSDINLCINRGEFVTICGKSGCGKTTLLRLLKSALSPHGSLSGSILLNGRALSEYNVREQASEIGFVMQNPDNQIVTDKVWHELAFGLESLGCPTVEIRTRVSEMASYFGIQTWFHTPVTELSGGQKQLLNLASVMVMQPSVLILDEPTSQLDPIAAQEFLKTLEKINRELGTTIILTEHRLEDAFAASDRIIVMDRGRIISDAPPKKTGELLKGHDMYDALPAPMRIWGAVGGSECPVTVREGREWLDEFATKNTLRPELIPSTDTAEKSCDTVIELKDVWFRYEKDLPDVIRGLSLKINKGELYAIVGGNGTGKTTALSLISGLNRPYRGKILINGERCENTQKLCGETLSVLPQNPQSLFVQKTVYLDLLEMLPNKKFSQQERDAYVTDAAKLCRIEDLLTRHPYDLSGGEQQRAALAKVLLTNPDILLLDEPTKGMDAHFKQCFAEILLDLKSSGVTIVMVSHDIEFCAAYADRCAMFFDGGIAGEGTPREFFSGKSFYTTSANRMSRSHLKAAVLAEDVILACGGEIKENQHRKAEVNLPTKPSKPIEVNTKQKITPARVIAGCILMALFIATCIFGHNRYTDWRNQVYQIITILEASALVFCFVPKREIHTEIQQERGSRRLDKRTAAAALSVLIAVPLTIFGGMFYFGDKKYYFISLLIILETLIPFFVSFESRKPDSRELIIISVICAIAVAGRAAFYMIPQFEPVIAVVIIAGICFGGETGFLVGVITGFVSNFFFGQGPWTPWQMFAFGMVGFIAGILFRKGFLRKTKLSLCIFGGLATVIIFGGVMNTSNALLYYDSPTAETFISSYVMGFPFDVIHAVSTVFFLWFIAEPMIDKIERIKTKYGLK